jgi:GLPGLI family protein
MKKIIVILCCFTLMQLNAQPVFYKTVKIEFEKTTYVRQLYKSLAPDYYDMVKDRLPETSVTYFDFVGDTSHSIYKPGKEVRFDPRGAFQGLANQNVVFTDYRTGTYISQKPVFDETFLVQDSLLNIKWKLTSDIRTIAGFECRKAVGIIDDSIAVFAFYTDEILVNGGPESANGLPGMILGLGMPRIHTTWFATKVEVSGVNLGVVAPASKGKKVNRQAMIKSLDKVLSDWGSYGKNLLWNFVI